MARIISTHARYAGTVAFTDNTTEFFHCQMEDDRLWSVNASESHLAEDKVKWETDGEGNYPYYARQNLVWLNGLPFLSGAVLDTGNVAVTKTINGLAIAGEVFFALDDGTEWSSYMSYDSHYGYQWNNSGNIQPTNLATYVDKIEAMLQQIIDVATLTIA